ncbi:hypothetical protein FRB97_006391 [Tulasnella sp. 331]|nr:hypothetical protein FRB97_006391 [Tulasnella sp. 331]
MFGTLRRQSNVSGANLGATSKTEKTLAPWFPNPLHIKKERVPVSENVNDKLETPKVPPSKKKFKAPTKPTGGYVISKPMAVQHEYGVDSRVVVVDQVPYSPVVVYDTPQARDETEPLTTSIYSTYVEPVNYNPNRRNHRRPPILSEFRPGPRSAWATSAPEAGPARWANATQAGLAIVRGSDKLSSTPVTPQDESAIPISTATTPSNAADLIRVEHTTRLFTLSVASRLPSASELPASPVELAAVEEATPSAAEALTKTTDYRVSWTQEVPGPNSSVRDPENTLLPRSPTTSEVYVSFEEMVRKADEEYECRCGGELYPTSVADDGRLASQADSEMGIELANIEDHPLTWEELKKKADREYEELFNYTAFPEVRSASPSTVASISAASADDWASVVDELSDVDWEEWRHQRDGDEEHQRRRGSAFEEAAQFTANMRGRSQVRARRTAPRLVRRVIRFFRIGREVVRLLSGGAMITPPTTPKRNRTRFHLRTGSSVVVPSPLTTPDSGLN